jgi:DNA-binding CsgD family transcriptional regulator
MITQVSAPVAVPMGAAVPSLVRWGLSSGADLVFRSLATFGPQSAQFLAADLGMSRIRVGQALAELRACGAVVASATGADPTWSSRPAAAVVADLRARRLRAARPVARAVAPLDVARGVGPVGGVVAEGVRYLPSRALTRARLAELTDVERYEQLTINTEQAFDAESARAGGSLDHKLVARGVRMRILTLPPADGDLLVAEAPDLSSLYQGREATELPHKLIVVDHRVALVPANPLDLDRGYLEISQPTVVAALVALFDRHWETAVDPRRCGMPMVTLTDRERQLVLLLAAGHTDVTAAGELRITARAVTKILRRLMDRLGVDNRFQLGLALGALRVAAPPSLTSAVDDQR